MYDLKATVNMREASFELLEHVEAVEAAQRDCADALQLLNKVVCRN